MTSFPRWLLAGALATAIICTLLVACSNDPDSPPDCADLDEATCNGTPGCRAIQGEGFAAPPASNPTTTYVGCVDGAITGGTAVTCMATGPEGPCWYRGDTLVPMGWVVGWNCANPTTFAECMAGASF